IYLYTFIFKRPSTSTPSPSSQQHPHNILSTTVPKFMQGKTPDDTAFRFLATFLTREHLYGFYYSNYDDTVRLARLCLFTKTWERVRGLSVTLPERTDDCLQVVPLPW